MKPERNSDMKKRMAGFVAAVAMVAMLAGCGESYVPGDPLYKTKVEKMVSVGNYNNWKPDVDFSEAKVDESEIIQLMKDVYSSSITEENGGITDRAVAVGDTVVIDYEGKKDGVAFSGGTAMGADLTIGSGQFIPGFEDQLVGVMPGETVDLDLTFPEEYGNAELAGQDVVFTVTVHFILPENIAPENMREEVIVSMGIEGVNTVEEFRNHVESYLIDSATDTREQEIRDAVLKALLDISTFKKIPEEFEESYRTRLTTGVEKAAAMYGMDSNSYANYFYGLDADTLVNKLVENSMKQEIALQAIANKENLNITDEELQSMLQEYAEDNGYETVEEFLGEQSKEDYRNYFMTQKVLDFLVEKCRNSEKVE